MFARFRLTGAVSCDLVRLLVIGKLPKLLAFTNLHSNVCASWIHSFQQPVEKQQRNVDLKSSPHRRQLVSPYVMKRLRDDVLMNVAYTNRLVLSRKAWANMSESSSSILERTKTVDASLIGYGEILSSVSHEEFMQLFCDIVNLPSRRLSPVLLKAMEEESCCRINRLDCGSLLYIADVFDVLMGPGTAQKYLSLLFKTFDYRWEKLIREKRDVVQLAYFIGSCRNCPIQLLNRIESYLLDHVREFTFAELSLLCHIFFVTNAMLRNFDVLSGIAHRVENQLTTISSINDRGKIEKTNGRSVFKLGDRNSDRLKVKDRISLDVLKKDDAISDANGDLTKYSTKIDSTAREGLKWYQLNNMLKTLRHAQFELPSFYDRLGNALVRLDADDLYMGDLTNIAFTYSSLRLSHANLFRYINQRAVHCLRNEMFPTRLKDLGRLVWSMAMLSVPVSSEIIDRLLSALRAQPTVMFEYPEAAVESLVALAVLNVFPQDLLRIACSQEFGALKAQRPLEHVFQMLLLKTALLFESAEHVGETPNISRIVVSVSERRFCGDLRHELKTRLGLAPLIDSLHDLAGDRSKCRAHFILPSSHIADVEIRVDRVSRSLVSFNHQTGVNTVDIDGGDQSGRRQYNDPLEFDRKPPLFVSSVDDAEFVKKLSVPLTTNNSGSHRKIVIKVMGYNQYTKNSCTLMGLTKCELTLLRRLGYEIHLIDPCQAQVLGRMNEVERDEWVRRLLADTCNVAL